MRKRTDVDIIFKNLILSSVKRPPIVHKTYCKMLSVNPLVVLCFSRKNRGKIGNLHSVNNNLFASVKIARIPKLIDWVLKQRKLGKKL